MVDKAWWGLKPPRGSETPIRIEGATTSNVDSSNIKDHEETLKWAFTSFLRNEKVKERFSGILESEEDIELVSNQTYDELESAMRDIWDSTGKHDRTHYPKAWNILPVLSSSLCNGMDDKGAWTKIHVAGLGVVAKPTQSHNTTQIKFPQTYLTQETWFVQEIERPRPETQSRDRDQGNSTTSGTDASGLFAQEPDATDASSFQQSKQEETSSAPGANDTDDSDDCVDAEGLELHRCASRS
jgi:hypothetical protein